MRRLFSTRGRNRTGTSLLTQDFESSASTSSATRAKMDGKYTIFLQIKQVITISCFKSGFFRPHRFLKPQRSVIYLCLKPHDLNTIIITFSSFAVREATGNFHHQ